MKSSEKKRTTPTVDEKAENTDGAEPAKPEAKPLDPKEEARRRSKEDLARKRRDLRKGGGRF